MDYPFEKDKFDKTYEIIKGLTFEDFCNEENKMSNDIFGRWKKIGFLEGLDNDTARKVAYCYESHLNKKF